MLIATINADPSPKMKPSTDSSPFHTSIITKTPIIAKINPKTFTFGIDSLSFEKYKIINKKIPFKYNRNAETA